MSFFLDTQKERYKSLNFFFIILRCIFSVFNFSPWSFTEMNISIDNHCMSIICMITPFLHRHLSNPKATLEAMLRPKITSLPGHIQSIFVQNILKLYGKILKAAEAKEDAELKAEVHQLLQDKLPVFIQSGDLEVQERVSTAVNVQNSILLMRLILFGK